MVGMTIFATAGLAAVDGEEAFAALRRKSRNVARRNDRLRPPSGSAPGLGGIWEYIASSSIDAADRVVERNE